MQQQSRRLPIKLQILCSFILVIFLVGGVLVWNIYQYNDAAQQNDSLFNHTVKRGYSIKEAQLDFTRALLDMRGFLAYGDNNYATSYQEKLNQSINIVKEYRKTSTMPETIEASEKLLTLLETYNTLGSQVIQMKKIMIPIFLP